MVVSTAQLQMEDLMDVDEYSNIQPIDLSADECKTFYWNLPWSMQLAKCFLSMLLSHLNSLTVTALLFCFPTTDNPSI